MPRLRVAAFERQIADERGWSLYDAHVELAGKGPHAWLVARILVNASGPTVSSLTFFENRPKQTAWSKAAERAGYSSAMRCLVDLRAVKAEAGLLETWIRDPDAVFTAEKRAPVPMQRPSAKRFPHKTWSLLRELPRPWVCGAVAAERRGRQIVCEGPWDALAYCVGLEVADPDRARVELGVQMYPRGGFEPSEAEIALMDRRLRAHLRPHGYRLSKIISGTGKPLPFRMVEATVRTWSEARRERRLLERVVFGQG